MQIHGLGHVQGPQRIDPAHRTGGSPAPQAPTRSTDTVDQLDISPEADFVSRVRELPEIRQDRVDAIRAQIEAGTYETEDKLDAAVSQLLNELV